MKRNSITKLAVVFVVLFSGLSYSSEAQTWDTFFKKSEKLYTKGKFNKIPKSNKKLRSKHIAKKYNNDTTLYVWLDLMDAKAYEAMKDYPKMANKIADASEGLIGLKETNDFRYVQGQLRLVDLYNEYGNYKKADSLIKKLDKEILFVESSIMPNELALRKAITDLNNGKLLTADSTFKALAKVWPTIINASYEGEIVDKLDVAYLNELYAQIYIYQVRAAIGRGEYDRAELLFDEYNKTVLKLVSAKSKTYFNWLFTRFMISYESGDYKKALKYIGQYFNAKPKGNRMEEGLLKNAELQFAMGSTSGVFATRDKFFKYTKSSKIDAQYRTANLLFIDALGDYLDVQYDQAFKNINDLHFSSSQVLPKDHALRKKTYEYGIVFSHMAVEHRYHQAANNYYPYLESQYKPEIYLQDSTMTYSR